MVENLNQFSYKDKGSQVKNQSWKSETLISQIYNHYLDFLISVYSGKALTKQSIFFYPPITWRWERKNMNFFCHALFRCRNQCY